MPCSCLISILEVVEDVLDVPGYVLVILCWEMVFHGELLCWARPKGPLHLFTLLGASQILEGLRV